MRGLPVLEGAATELGWPGTPGSPPLALSEPLRVLCSPPPCPAAGSGISGQHQGQRAEAMAGPRSAALGAQSRARRPWVSLGVPGCPHAQLMLVPPSPRPLMGMGREAKAHARLPLPCQVSPTSTRPERPQEPGHGQGAGRSGWPRVSPLANTHRDTALCPAAHGVGVPGDLRSHLGRATPAQGSSTGAGSRCPLRSGLGDL